jgi:exopolysaccharide biosynthesis polyprenyl glycosylphosphotransferase
MPSIVQRLANPYYQILGFVADDKHYQGEAVEGLAELGTASQLPRLVQELAVSEVIITTLNVRVGESEGTLIRSLVDCYEHGVQVTFLPDILEDLTARVSLDLVEHGWIGSLPLQHASTGVIFPIVKRAMDIVLAGAGLLPFALVFPLAALAIRLGSPGAIFYVQDRVGRGGKLFRVYKLRTMRTDAEKEGRAVWAEKRDPRVTGVGRLLRATHLDEFPQLVNILKGDMSAVGPRPERPELVAELDRAIPFYRLRHSVRPGLAGWAVVKQGYSSSKEDSRIKLEYDLYYIKHQSIWFDLLILLKSLVDSATFRGRY